MNQTFENLSLDKLAEILGLTIARDWSNKIITFLCMVSAYTKDSQFNLMYNGPSSTGKSHTPIEIAQLFPKEDVKTLGYCSPTAFFHEAGDWDDKRKCFIVDLSRKILIFLDQPHTDLLARLRPLLSHDDSEISIKITDKTEKKGMRAKTVLLLGYPAVIFASAGLAVDEQEATRFILLSPEMGQEKLKQAVGLRIKKDADTEAFREWVNSNTNRQSLQGRILAIRGAGIEDIKIESTRKIEDFFLRDRFIKPRHSRDAGKVISLIKAIALVNLWHRKREGPTLFANDEDIEDGLRLWKEIGETQELNLPPFVYEFYRETILEIWQEKRGELKGGGSTTVGMTRKEVLDRYRGKYRQSLPEWKLKKQILPMLESSGLIHQEADSLDSRKLLIYPTPQFPLFSSQKQETAQEPDKEAPNRQDNTEQGCGVAKEDDNGTGTRQEQQEDNGTESDKPDNGRSEAEGMLKEIRQKEKEVCPQEALSRALRNNKEFLKGFYQRRGDMERAAESGNKDEVERIGNEHLEQLAIATSNFQ